MLARTFDKALLVGNPTSGVGKVRRWFDRVAERLEQAGCALEIVLTRRAGDGTKAAADHTGANALVVAFGGDGTFNEILNGADLERSALAIIPAGAGNVLAKELGMSHHPLEAVGQLLSGRVVRFDIGLCNGRRFICVFGAGVDAWVVKMVHQGRSRGLTQWHYVPHVVSGLLRPSPWQVAVEVDGRPFARGLDQVAVGNTRSYGGPMEMTPAAVPDDGLFDVLCVRRRSVADIVDLTACGLLRTLHWSRRARYGRGKRILVTSPQPDAPYELDGDPAGILPVEVVMQAGAARLLVPASYRPMRRALPQSD